jgi:Protein of unknown function (DUF1569)
MTATRQYLEQITQNYLTLITQELTADRAPLWGSMTAQHMVEHLSMIFAVSIGKIPVNTGDADEAKLNYRRERFWSVDGVFPKGFTRPDASPDLPPLRFPDLDSAKAKFAQAAHDFAIFYDRNPDTVVVHPYFGALNFKQWTFFHERHIRHHLSQFGFEV